MGKTLKKYLLFDLDTTALKEEFGPKRYTVAYSMIRQFLENQGTQKRTSRASAESKTQSARATGKDNIIQFALRQNGKDIPSSKGTFLASKSQKYIAMANALNAASKSYVYRNEVAR